jgi:tight adherence protein B
VGKLAAEAANEDRKLSLREQFEAAVEQSGLRLSPERLLTIMVCSAGVLGSLVFLIRQSFLLAGMAAAFGAFVPFAFMLSRRKARLEKLLGQLPDAFDLMGRVVRAGQTMSQALQSVADEFDQPVAGEFAYCYEQQNLGLSPEFALRDLARRTGLLEIKIFVLAVLVQQQSGGNLAELLDKLSAMIRERFRIRGKIRALTAEGRAQAVLLLVLPIALMFLLMVMSQDYARALAKYPNMIIGMLIMEVIGALWIRKIVNFDY